MSIFSIVTPSYNQAHFIERTIESVISQTWDFTIEYFVEDAGSTDSTVDILKKYERIIASDPKYTHVTFHRVSEKDKGQSHAINKGLAKTTWDILTYLNSDDTYLPWCLEKVAESLEQSWSQRCYGKCHIINLEDKTIRTWLTSYKNLWLKAKRSYWKLLTENYISQMATFRTREAYKAIWDFDEEEHLCMDYNYWLRLWKLYDPAYIDEYLANFRFYHTSKSGARFEKQFEDQYRLAKNFSNWKYKIAMGIHRIFYIRTKTIYKILYWLKL